MKRCALVLALGLLGLPATAAEEPALITILQPEDGLLTHRPSLDVAVRLDGDSGGGDGIRVFRRLELYLGEALVGERGRASAAGSTIHFTVPLRPRAPGRMVLTAVAWPADPGAEPVEASVEIDVRPHLVLKDLENPDDDDDQDGLTNGEEVEVYGTDPTLRDTDGDGFWDGAEVEPGVSSDPLATLSIPPMTVVAPPPAAVVRREPFDTSILAVNTHLARPPVRVEPAEVFVFLVVPEGVPGVAGETVTVPLELQAGEAAVAAVAFSIDYDAGCLGFDPTDADSNGLPDALAFNLPPGFSATAFVDLDDPDGEIDVFVFSNPVAALPSGTLATVDFAATCAPPVGEPLTVPVAFSFDPRASFGDVEGQDIPGAALAGSVKIFGGERGDVNAENGVTAADFPSLVLEIFDSDGNFWLDTPGGTFPGDPVGSDANADTTVDAGDLSCIGRIIFGLPCGPGDSLLDVHPLLVLGELRPLPSGNVLAELRLEESAGIVTSVVFSLDLDPGRLAFDPADDDGDGMPDAVRFHEPAALRSVVFDPSDSDGELDFVLSDFSATPRPFEDGILLEIELTPVGSAHAGLLFSADPALSFGSATGESLPGEGVVEFGVLFADGFESGDAAGWSRTIP